MSQPTHVKNIGRQHSIPEEGDDKTQAGNLREGFLVLTGRLLYLQFILEEKKSQLFYSKIERIIHNA